MDNYNLDIKRTFLSFAQALFAEHPKYTWNENPAETKILIVDKHVSQLNRIEAKRAIILSRGTYGWRQTSIGQLTQPDTRTMGDRFLGQSTYTDLIRGSLTFNCLAQEGLVAEDLASLLFVNMAALKDQFKQNGIHEILNITIGEEALLKTDSKIELIAVPVSVQFETQKTFGVGATAYDLMNLVDNTGKSYYVGIHYMVTSSGLLFYEAPESGLTLTITYTNAITLATVTEELGGVVDGDNKLFTYSYPAYTDYPIFSGIAYTISRTTEAL